MLSIKKFVTPFIAICGILLLMVMSSLFVMQPVTAAPPAIPTPVSVNYSSDNVNPPSRFWADGTVITQSGASSAFVMGEAELLDIHYNIDIGTTVNTTTLTLQFSNDGTNWVNGLAVLSAVAADQSDIRQFQNFGYRTRLNLTLANNEPITITHLSAMARR